MSADYTQIKADKFAFGRMRDRSAHPSNPLRLRRGKTKLPSRPGGMDTDTIAGLSQWCL
jgi:hypothetical protein